MKEEEKRIKELDGNTMKECNEGMQKLVGREKKKKA